MGKRTRMDGYIPKPDTVGACYADNYEILAIVWNKGKCSMCTRANGACLAELCFSLRFTSPVEAKVDKNVHVIITYIRTLLWLLVYMRPMLVQGCVQWTYDSVTTHAKCTARQGHGKAHKNGWIHTKTQYCRGFLCRKSRDFNNSLEPKHVLHVRPC